MSPFETISLLVLAVIIATQVVVLLITKFSGGEVGRRFSFSEQIYMLIGTLFVYGFLLYVNTTPVSVIWMKIAHAIEAMIWTVIALFIYILHLCIRIRIEGKNIPERKDNKIQHIDKRI